eukprot:7426265-Pyramimonas_sp.AAC.1
MAPPAPAAAWSVARPCHCATEHSNSGRRCRPWRLRVKAPLRSSETKAMSGDCSASPQTLLRSISSPARTPMPHCS